MCCFGIFDSAVFVFLCRIQCADRFTCLQAAGKFDAEVVQRQLRYTGMLATVQIRQAGYNYRLTFEVFTNMLLPVSFLTK